MARGDPLQQLIDLVRADRGALIGAARAEGLRDDEAVECVGDALCTWLSAERGGTLPESAGARRAAAFTMVRNAARNARRRHARRMPHVPIEDEGVSALAVAVPGADLLLAHAEETVRLRACIATLCSAQRAVVILRLLEEQTGEDVAAALGLTRGHVDVLAHRAKASLRACMRG